VGSGLCNVERRPNFWVLVTYISALKAPQKETMEGGVQFAFRLAHDFQAIHVSNNLTLKII
jgi:hypothetical protein